MKEQVVVGQLGRKEQEEQVVEEKVLEVVEEKEQAADSLSLASASILIWFIEQIVQNMICNRIDKDEI